MNKKEEKEIRKNYKTFLTNLLVCFIIKSVMENRITITEIYAIIDKIADTKRRERVERQRRREIMQANESFQRITQRFNQGRVQRNNNSEEYKSYFSINKVD
jgi:hypothetical protein